MRAMAGETTRTRGIVLAIRPWSQTSHVVSWLTPDAGVVSTVVKGAVRPKSAFLGQYDLFYECELVYYVRERGDAHAIREVSPIKMREGLRGHWRETSLAGYAAELAMRLAPSSGEAQGWYALLDSLFDRLCGGTDALDAELLALEIEALGLAGLAPDLSGFDPRQEWQPFAIDLGRYGEGNRTARLSRGAAVALRAPFADNSRNFVLDALRFIGVFYAFHLDLPADVRRSVVQMAAKNKEQRKR